MNSFNQKFQTASLILGEDILKEFIESEGRYLNFTKEVSFVCYIGKDRDVYSHELRRMEQLMGSRQGGAGGSSFRSPSNCVRAEALDSRISVEQAEKYGAMYGRWSRGEDSLPFHFENIMWQQAFQEGYKRIIQMYIDYSGRKEPGPLKNFSVKIMYWIDAYFPRLFTDTMKIGRFPKFIIGGKVKLQEYLFLYFLTQLGCWVLYMGQESEIQIDSRLVGLAQWRQQKKGRITDLGHAGDSSACGEGPVVMPASAFRRRDRDERQTVLPSGNSGGYERQNQRPKENRTVPQPVRRQVVIPSGVHPFEPQPRNQAPVQPQPSSSQNRQQAANPSGVSPSRPSTPRPSNSRQREEVLSSRPLDWEELAALSSSVVMIHVFDKNKECFKTGSGVMISTDGYILTNFHVARDGIYYGIQIEEEQNIFYTNELIKYNQYHDLAVLKIDRMCRPIPVYRGPKKLVRGQKVAAIGSPLGLFNSFSDGLISGFRKMEDVSMIQFTAPTSHGSSGGALLDTCGRLIGIITGGFDGGQNLNLAVDYETIQMFAGGFLRL